MHHRIRLIVRRKREIQVGNMLDSFLLRLEAFGWVLIVQIENLFLVFEHFAFRVCIDIHNQVKLILFRFLLVFRDQFIKLLNLIVHIVSVFLLQLGRLSQSLAILRRIFIGAKVAILRLSCLDYDLFEIIIINRSIILSLVSVLLTVLLCLIVSISTILM